MAGFLLIVMFVTGAGVMIRRFVVMMVSIRMIGIMVGLVGVIIGVFSRMNGWISLGRGIPGGQQTGRGQRENNILEHCVLQQIDVPVVWPHRIWSIALQNGSNGSIPVNP